MEGAARFPYPPHGHIPNFAGAERAAARLLGHGACQYVATIKANPDAPQRPLRLDPLQRGITLYMPTPHLRARFYRPDPGRIATASLKEAASLSGSAR